MKAKLYYILLFWVLFLHPQYSCASNARPDSFFNRTVQKIEQDISVLDDSQNYNSFFITAISVEDEIFAEIDIDDECDSDGSFSARKKISFGDSTFYIPEHKSHPFCNNLVGKYCNTYFYHLPPSHFILLRVFRI